MFKSFFELNTAQEETKRKEGDLFKVITAYGKTFEIYYGYYDDADRRNPCVEPMEMYPDFSASPVFTDDGYPFVVAMQKPCGYFCGEPDEDNTCYQCKHYERCEELIGVCRHEKRARQ